MTKATIVRVEPRFGLFEATTVDNQRICFNCSLISGYGGQPFHEIGFVLGADIDVEMRDGRIISAKLLNSTIGEEYEKYHSRGNFITRIWNRIVRPK